ncbi:calmodulin-binding protein 60 A-like [Lycium ferocissimum]|uniref:calmodulin-binding protein 60 A-like n=1 Tax=Lycium ferocissimum TaxID=112874 RepID=UPI00281651ED|nr:calmodulin-binding protein 60 A-like [Lycium ferocissimum]
MSHFNYGNAGYQQNNVKSPIFTRNAQRKLRQSTESRCYRLKFLQAIPAEVYTGENIVVNGTTGIDIALVDAVTGDLVNYGPEAWAKVEIVVLNGDFDPGRDWTADQFNIKIVGGRGRSSMFGKDLYLNLQGGIGSVDGIKLKHGSEWKMKIKLRFGARVVDLPDTVKVREAVTGLFLVKDKRLLRSSKRDPPSPSDEVWRLKQIGKNGPFHKKLFANHIRTVGDFLTESYKDAKRLRDILGPTMAKHMWDAALTHAKRCKKDDRPSLYSPLETCQEIAMVNHLDSFTNMPKNQQEPGFPPVSLDYSQEDSFRKLTEYVSSDEDVIFEDPKQVPYASPQSTPNNLLLEDDILESINELLLCEEPGKSCIVHSNEYNDHNIKSSSPEVKKLPLDLKSWKQCVIPGNVYCAFCNEESYDDQQRRVNNFVLLPPDATVFKGYGKGKKRWTLLFILLKWFSISRNIKIEKRITKRIRLS